MRTFLLVGTVCLLGACSDDETSPTGNTNASDASAESSSGGSDASTSGGTAGVTAGGAAGVSSGGSAGVSSGGSAGVASGGTAGSPTDAGADAGTKWDLFCQEESSLWTSCGKAGFECAPSVCVYSIYDPIILDDYTSCLLAQSCSEVGSDDDCFSDAGTVNGQLPPANQAKVDAFLAKYQSCGGFGGPVKLDWVRYFSPLLLKTYFDQASTCLEKPCADMPACYAALGAAFDCLDAP